MMHEESFASLSPFQSFEKKLWATLLCFRAPPGIFELSHVVVIRLLFFKLLLVLVVVVGVSWGLEGGALQLSRKIAYSVVCVRGLFAPRNKDKKAFS